MIKSINFKTPFLFIPAMGTLSACSSYLEPPMHLIMDQDVNVSFQTSSNASEKCSEAIEKVKGKKMNNISACAVRLMAGADPLIIMPNPCTFEGKYALLLCHELGHVNQMAMGSYVDHKGWASTAKIVKTAESELDFRPLPDIETPDSKVQVIQAASAKPLENEGGKPIGAKTEIVEKSVMNIPLVKSVKSAKLHYEKNFTPNNGDKKSDEMPKLRGFSMAEPVS